MHIAYCSDQLLPQEGGFRRYGGDLLLSFAVERFGTKTALQLQFRLYSKLWLTVTAKCIITPGVVFDYWYVFVL